MPKSIPKANSQLKKKVQGKFNHINSQAHQIDMYEMTIRNLMQDGNLTKERLMEQLDHIRSKTGVIKSQCKAAEVLMGQAVIEPKNRRFHINPALGREGKEPDMQDAVNREHDREGIGQAREILGRD